MLAQQTIHNGGDLHFGANELLYVSVGDGGCVIDDDTQCGASNTNSRRLDIPNGKILRVTRDGGVPATNPYVGAPGARRCTLPAGPQPGSGPCTETFASGFRNPFRFAQLPGTNTFYVNDVGQSTWEEIDRLRAGSDYGWNVREGHCRTGSTTDCGPTPYQNPLHDYSQVATGCRAITGGAFVPEGLWPAPYSGSYLFADFGCGKVFRLVPRPGGGFRQVEFLTEVSCPGAPGVRSLRCDRGAVLPRLRGREDPPGGLHGGGRFLAFAPVGDRHPVTVCKPSRREDRTEAGFV